MCKSSHCQSPSPEIISNLKHALITSVGVEISSLVYKNILSGRRQISVFSVQQKLITVSK